MLLRTLFLSLSCCWIFGCAKRDVSTFSQTKILRTCLVQDPTTLDPSRSSDFISSSLVGLLYEGLTRCKGGSDLELAIAHKVEISPNGQTYFFFLRKALWTDGAPVIARDFEKAWKKILDPQFLSPCAYLLYPIKNGESYAKGLCSSEEVGIYAIDDGTLRVDLEAPTPYFLSLTAFPLYLPTPSHLEGRYSCWSSEHKTTLVTNGPFFLAKLQPGVEISLQKNPRFWNAKAIELDQIHWSIIAHETTALHLFEKGELDLLGGPFFPLTSEAVSVWRKKEELQFLPMAASTFCVMNTTSFPFSNFALRKSLSLALQGKLEGEIEEIGQIPPSHFLPPSLDGRLADALHSAEKTAKQYLLQSLQELQISQAELENRLRLYYKANPLEKKIAQTIQQIWKKELGLFVELEQVEAKTFAQKLYQKNYQIAITSWIAQFHDPINILDRFKEESQQKNYSGWSSPLYKEYLRQIAYTLDPELRNKQIEQASELLEAATPLIPLYHWKSPLLIHPRIQGFSSTDSGGILLERCSMRGLY